MATYIVTGTLPQFGHKPGEEFDADLSEEIERRAINRGGIALAQDGDPFAGKTRDELNELAHIAGVPSPGDLSKKDEVIEAIKAAANQAG